MSDKRFLSESGLEVYTGNELILKGGLESRMNLLTGYPGSPVSDIFDAVFANRELLKERGVLGQMANNEALAAARLNGARMASLRAVAVMKSVGMHVAADGIAIGNLTEPNHPEGGALIIVGDDPWNDTTQINSDSRFLAQHLQTPILEPSTFQEIKDWLGEGFDLSGHSNLYVTMVITTNQADGGGSVRVRPNHYPTVNLAHKTELSSSELAVGDFVMIPPHTSQKEATLKARYARFLELARKKELNRIFYRERGARASAKIGFITSGISYCYLEHALHEMECTGLFPILKMGVTYPLDEELVRRFLSGKETVIVVEEKRPFLENQVKSLLAGAADAPAVHGKNFPFGLEGLPAVRGLNASVLIERLAPLFLKLDLPELVSRKPRIESELSLLKEIALHAVHVPHRTPTFCPGCPHRDSAVVSLKMKEKLKDAEAAAREGREPTDLIFHGESGCHSMLQFEPNIGLMQNYSGMGLGGGTGAGIAPFIRNKQVVFLGDSTFFHSGMIAVSDSIKNRQDITYVILDNKTTAMTGHQPTPGNEFDILGRETFAQQIEKVIRGMAGGAEIPVLRADPADRDGYSRLLEELVLQDGVKVVVADKECAITYQRRLKKSRRETLRRRGYLEKEEFINITPEVCEYCLECTRQTGCPGLTVEETDFGPKIVTDLSACVADGACTKGKVCPSFERVTIRRRRPPRKLPEPAARPLLPPPSKKDFESMFYISTFAVGGMGAGVVSAVLVRAGLKEGYQVLFLDKKGLAIRNGGVYGHILYSKEKERTLSPLVPYGKADLLLGIDVLEAARGIDPSYNLKVASARHTAAIVNSHKNETVLSLMGRERFDPAVLEESLKKYTRAEDYFSIDFSEISQSAFGSKLYANILLIGAACQKGLLPISLSNLEGALKETVPAQELNENLAALRLGREIVLEREKFYKQIQSPNPSRAEIVEQKAAVLAGRFWGGARLARRYRQLSEKALRWIHVDEPTNRKIALRIYELIQYESPEVAESYLSAVWEIYRKDRPDMRYAATRAVVENLFKVTAIKDEIYVAHLLTSREKFERDRRRYGVDEANGDRIRYVHLNRPAFDLWGFELRFNLDSRNWMLNIVKYCKFLRRWLPEWHRREKEFRDWYRALLRQFNYFQDDDVYRLYLEILRAPEGVNGYREIRYPKMAEARSRVETLLFKIKSGNPRPEAEPLPSAQPDPE